MENKEFEEKETKEEVDEVKEEKSNEEIVEIKEETKNSNGKKILFLISVLVVFAVCYVVSYVISNKIDDKNDKEEEKTEEKVEKKEEVNNNDALLWEVKSDTATIYLAGSIHVGTEDTYPLQKKLLDAFDNSDALAVELDIIALEEDIEAMLDMTYSMMYMDDTTLENHISPETLNLFNEYVEKYGISGVKNLEQLYMYKPWTLENLISNDLVAEAGLDSELGVDMYFLNEAKAKGMEIIEVESAELQFGMMDGYSKELQEFLLLEALQTPREESIEELKKMLDMWENGDVFEFEEYLNEEEDEDFTEEELKLYEEYYNAMILNRNIGMTDKVEELLKGDKDVFYIVGSAHMIGEDGIIKMLQDRGYTVNKL